MAATLVPTLLAAPDPGKAASDAELVAASRCGNRTAFAELVERYQPLVSSTAFSLSRSSVQSEEITQETFVAAWRQLGQLKRPDRFRFWLYGIARRLTRRFQRNEYYQSARGLAVLAAPERLSATSPLDRMIGEEQERILRHALGAIPESYRVTLVLFYRERQSLADIARVFDVSENCIKMRLRRGRQLLGQVMTHSIEASASDRTRARSVLVAAVLATITAIPPGAARATVLRGAAAPLAVALLVSGGLYWASGLVPRHEVRAPIPGQRPAVPLWATAVAPPAPAGGADEISPDSFGMSGRRFPVLAFDFEDGILPPLFTQGQIVPRLPGGDNRYCVIGTVRPWWGQHNVVTLGDPMERKPVFHYTSTMAVSFDYWIGSSDNFDAITVMVYAYALPEKYLHRIYLHGGSYEKWTHVEARLGAFIPTDERSPPIPDGDPIGYMGIWGGDIGGKPFYVDNLKIVAGGLTK